jgi:hypothetical protein
MNSYKCVLRVSTKCYWDSVLVTDCLYWLLFILIGLEGSFRHLIEDVVGDPRLWLSLTLSVSRGGRSLVGRQRRSMMMMRVRYAVHDFVELMSQEICFLTLIPIQDLEFGVVLQWLLQRVVVSLDLSQLVFQLMSMSQSLGPAVLCITSILQSPSFLLEPLDLFSRESMEFLVEFSHW